MTRLFFAALLLAAAACGTAPTATTGSRSNNQPASGDLPHASTAVTVGTLVPPEGGTFFDLIAPPLPAGTAAEALRATLAGATVTYTLTAFHVTGPTWPGTPVTSGTYTLTFLDETGAPTAYRRSVEVVAGRSNYVVVGGIWVAPASAVSPERTASQGLRYEISGVSGKLKSAVAGLNTVIDLPPGVWAWVGLSADGIRRIEPLNFTTNESITAFEWGSIYVAKRAGQTLTLSTSLGVLLDDILDDGTEYLLPSAPQSAGCRPYDVVLDRLTVFRRALCSDGMDHVTINVK